jgi:hypothetical protein
MTMRKLFFDISESMHFYAFLSLSQVFSLTPKRPCPITSAQGRNESREKNGNVSPEKKKSGSRNWK